MNTETGEVFFGPDHKLSTPEMQKRINELIQQGQPIVPVSQKVAEAQRAGQIAMQRAQNRTQQQLRRNYNRRNL